MHVGSEYDKIVDNWTGQLHNPTKEKTIELIYARLTTAQIAIHLLHTLSIVLSNLLFVSLRKIEDETGSREDKSSNAKSIQ